MPLTAGKLYVNFVLIKFSRVMGFGIPVFNHNPGPCKLFHGIMFDIII